MPFQKGNTLWDNPKTKRNLFKEGHSVSQSIRQKISIANSKNKNPMWKGSNVKTINAGRTRAERWYKLKPCVRCGEKAERHHKDGNTLNNKPENINFLCRKCHMKSDGRMFKRDAYGRFK